MEKKVVEEKSQEPKEYSNYGKFEVVEKLDLKFPKTEIKIERKSDKQFSYYRKNSEGQIKSKIIPRKGKDLKIEVAPVLPVNLPSKKTNDLMFLRLAKPIFIEKNSKISILIQFPIEIGVYIFNSTDNSYDFFDCFTCEPMHSRFALYGTPETGKLCMYSKVGIVEKSEKEPYIFAFMKISIANELAKGVTIGKFVFPVTNHDIYYKDGDNEAHIDDIKAKLREEYSKEILKIKKVDFSDKNKDWKITPNNEKGPTQSFVMERGFD